MPPASVDPLSHTLGRIEHAIEQITKTLNEDRMASAQYRTDIRRDLTTVRDMVHDLKNRVNNNADELAHIRPDVEDWRMRREQAKGAFSLASSSARLAWALFGAAALAFSSMVAWVMKFGPLK